MIDGIQSATASSFTRQLNNIEESASATSMMPVVTPDVQSADFGTVMAEMANDMVSAIQRGEQASMDGMNGQASTQEVVEAVMNAERTLQTALAVRDKIITGYLEISRMAI